MNAVLVLRGIHQPPAPPWWPPAPGWWIVAAVVLVAMAMPAWRAWRRRRRRIAFARLFDAAVDAAAAPAARLAAISGLLRRASRRIDPAADKLLGDDWLRFLDAGKATPAFAGASGALLRDGIYRVDVDAEDVEALRTIARARFVAWMDRR
ncbi:MAG: DUF4381 family protein [Lysobacter sp.]|nr:DUF4381 family protein [Lysobacter sp.]